jgi:hypothetical protein
VNVLARITWPRAIWISAAVAVLVHVGALDNEWAFDDQPILPENTNARSMDAAFGAFFDTYWPEDAGQYRPAIVLSYALDRELTLHNPVWSHGVNIVLHGIVTALFVMVLMAWMKPIAGLASGLVFAVHPVHVEAVAGVVGRAELVVGALLLGAIVTARKYRAAEFGTARTVWLYLTLAQVVWALFSKEHAIVAVAVLALDEITTGRLNLRRNLPLYLGVVVVSLSWLTIFRAVAGEYVDVAVAATLRYLDHFERLATVAPIQLHVVRLLTWPFDLAADYNPQTLPRLTEWTWAASVASMLVAAIVALSVALYRTLPVVTFGIWVAIITYSPTSNVLFGSGIILGERNLYLAAGATAIVVGVIVRDLSRVKKQPLLGLAVLLVIGVFGWKTVDRIPAWKNTSTLVIEDFVNHPENYRGRLRLASVLRGSDRFAEAMAEGTAAAAIYPEDPLVALTVIPDILRMGYVSRALEEAERVHAIIPEHTRLSQMAVRARLGTGQPESALALGRRTLERWPDDPVASDTYIEIVDSLRVPDWARAAARAHSSWANLELLGGTAALVQSADEIPNLISSDGCWDVNAAVALAGHLAPELVHRFSERLTACDPVDLSPG